MALTSLFARGGAASDSFVMFWLVLMLGINLVDCVRCLHCKDNIMPDHAPADCPLVVVVAANVAAVSRLYTCCADLLVALRKVVFRAYLFFT